MTHSSFEKARELSKQGLWTAAVTLLREQDVAAVADFMMTLPFEEQRALFRAMPVEFAASLIADFPYFHSYVLLHSRPAPEMHKIVDAMNPTDRDLFLDALPEEAWQSLMNELEATRGAGAEGHRGCGTSRGRACGDSRPATPKHIIEARQIGKSYQQPDGRQIQVIAPVDLSIEADSIVALLGPSGSGKSTMLRMLSGLAAPSSGEVLWHDTPMPQCHPNVAIVFQSFALFPWLTVLENVETPLLARGDGAGGAAPAGSSGAGLRRIEKFRDGLPQGIVGRNEAARGICAGAGRRAGDSVHGRTVLGAGRADRGESARRIDGACGLRRKFPRAPFFW